jgi:predicted nucleic acid-binding protein
MIVVDANILAFYIIDGKRTAETNCLRIMDAEWMVPSFWSVEFQSILWKYVRYDGMPLGMAQEYLDKALDIFAPNEMTPSPDIVLRDAANWKITVYDAQYVSLAREFGVRCVTEDIALQEKCPDIAISIEDFLRTGDAPVVREPGATYGSRRSKRIAGRPAGKRGRTV